MKNWMKVAGLIGLLGIGSCGEDRAAPVDPNTTGKGGKTSAAGGAGDEAGESTGGTKVNGGRAGTAGKTSTPSAGEGGNTSEGGAGGEGGEVSFGSPPVVTVLSPEALADPLLGDAIVGDSVDVLCRAVPGEPEATAIDPGSVKVAVLDAQGSIIAVKDAASTVNADEYQGEVPLTTVATGKVGFRCSARTLGNVEGTDELESFVDHGPLLTLDTPVDGTQVGLKDDLKVTFRAEPQPLVIGDNEADVDTVELLIAGVPVPSSPVNGSPGKYEATADLDGTSFNPKPSGATPITLRATNKRSPSAVTAIKNYQILVDGVGPVIATAMDKALVGGTVKLSFTVTDIGSGVNADSIVATLNTMTHPFNIADGWTHVGDAFSYEFDSRNITGSKVQITVKLQAEDNVKNAALEQTLTLYLDNVPPKVDLDPQVVRIQRLLNPFHCSTAFDPVGTEAADDAVEASGYDLFRALVMEQTNFVPGSPAALHYSGTQQNSVRLYFHSPSPNSSLLVNSKTPGSGTCDEIGDTQTPLELAALNTTGSPFYAVNDGNPLGQGSCPFPPSSPPAPPALCGGVSDMSYVMYMAGGQLTEPAVYVHSPTAGVECTGTAWEYRTFMDKNDTEGWVCLAARAVDKIGNVGVSPPLRLCVDPDLDDAEQPDCMTMSTLPPDCTDGCTAPPRGGYFILAL